MVFAQLRWILWRPPIAQDRRELKSNAPCCWAASNIAYPGLTVIQRKDPFDLQQLEPFLASLRDGTPSGSGRMLAAEAQRASAPRNYRSVPRTSSLRKRRRDRSFAAAATRPTNSCGVWQATGSWP